MLLGGLISLFLVGAADRVRVNQSRNPVLEDAKSKTFSALSCSRFILLCPFSIVLFPFLIFKKQKTSEPISKSSK